MDPLYAAGLLAAAYDLGLLHQVAPDTFKDDKGLDLRSAGIAGLAGYALGNYNDRHHVEELEHALQAVAALQAQRDTQHAQREQALHQAYAVSEAARSALLAADSARNGDLTRNAEHSAVKAPQTLRYM